MATARSGLGTRGTRAALGAGLLALALAAPLGGCASQDKYDQTVSANRSLQEQLATMERERDDARQNLRAAQDQLDQTRGSYRDLQGRYDDLAGSVRGLNETNDEYMRRIAHLELGPLPKEVESAIAALARAHPELLSFDPQMGMVRFASDFTFDLGSIAIKSDATETLNALASILNEPAARTLEARIIGHTDNVPIGRPETRRQHPTNTHLSVHRAIAVGEALTQAGVDPARIQVAGYGEHRPIAPNGKGGAAANRRVEIFLAPKADATMAAAPAGETSTAVPTEEPMK